MSIPIITQDHIRERGYVTDVVVCPNCQSKWEILRHDRADAGHCMDCQTDRPPVDYTTWVKTRAIAEIDLLNVRMFLAYLKLLGLEQINRNQIVTAQYLAQHICDLESALFDHEGIRDSWTLDDLHQAFNPYQDYYLPHIDGGKK